MQKQVAYCICCSEAYSSHGLPFHFRGNEPFWMVKIERDRIIFRTPEEQIAYPPVQPQRDSGVLIFETKIKTKDNKDSILRITIFSTSCTDSMSGQVFPYTAEVTYDDKTYHGCAA